MFSLRTDAEEFVNRPGGKEAGAGHWPFLVMVLLMILGFVAWAMFFEIEEVTRASGRVVPSSQVQTVQSLEGGIVAAIDVEQGDIVDAGQVLFQIDATSVQSSLGELESRHRALTAELVRLRAEVSGAEVLIFPDEVMTSPILVEAEQSLFATRRTQLALELNVLKDRVAQKAAELAEIQANNARTIAVAKPLRREVEISEQLYSDGTISEIELLRLQAKLAELDGDLTVIAASEDRIRASMAETDNQIVSTRASFGLAAQERIAVVLTDLAVVEEALTAARDRVQRTALSSPARGTVNRISVSNVGSVVQPGVVLAEIVPLDDTLLIEAEVSPRDVAFVRVGANASVKITAYDYLRYGDLPAQVERIGADALQTEDGTPFFQVTLRTDKTALESDGQEYFISPGMVAQIDIQSDQKTVLEYLIQPVLRMQHEALRER